MVGALLSDQKSCNLQKGENIQMDIQVRLLHSFSSSTLTSRSFSSHSTSHLTLLCSQRNSQQPNRNGDGNGRRSYNFRSSSLRFILNFIWSEDWIGSLNWVLARVLNYSANCSMICSKDYFFFTKAVLWIFIMTKNDALIYH